ncbi:suppressor of fused domain protein [Aquitalea magnusonii]|uniref:suppressor of fused domain protein n=1 Tax=Aquitalea magnusonii TaxID=332411 RepID=UPI000B5C4FBA|nr:suppressor of fused domain protein [Aquitalea magnusonii]
MTNLIIDHIEENFGEIEKGWDFRISKLPNFQVVECSNGLLENITTIISVGLAQHKLKSRRSEKIIRHEILLSFDKDCIPSNAVAIIKQIAETCVETREALLENDIIKKVGIVFDNHKFDSLWVKPPVFFNENSFSYSGSDVSGDICIFAWLIPITTKERCYIEENGSEAFENVLETVSVDFFDLNRNCIFCESDE